MRKKASNSGFSKGRVEGMLPGRQSRKRGNVEDVYVGVAGTAVCRWTGYLKHCIQNRSVKVNLKFCIF